MIEPSLNQKLDTFGRFRASAVNTLLGERQGLTVIGPASIVKEIKRDPTKIELLTNDSKLKPKRNGKSKKNGKKRKI